MEYRASWNPTPPFFFSRYECVCVCFSRDALIAAREAARRGKDFATADSALAELRAAGIGVDDATR